MTDKEILKDLRKYATAKSLAGQERVLDRLAGVKGIVEQLMQFLDHDNPDVAHATIMVFGRIGPGAAPAVGKLIEKIEDCKLRSAALSALAEIGPAAAPAIPSLIRVLKIAIKYKPDDHPADPIPMPPHEICDAMTACSALMAFGDAAKAALPELRRCARLKTHDTLVVFLRLEAATAVWAIASEAESIIRVACDFLRNPDWSPIEGLDGECESVVDLLSKIGPPAASAIPALKRAMKNAPDAAKKRLAEALAKIDVQK